MRYFIELSYDGTPFSGWQTQPNAPTVQETIEEALTRMLRIPIAIVGAGRTDAGVHAHSMTAHADLSILPQEAAHLAHRLNGYLPPEIAIRQIYPVRDDAHARFDAQWRTYHYYITRRKDPFGRAYALRLHSDLDFEAMNRAAAHLLNYRDFTSFSKLHTDNKTNLCVVTEARWHWDEESEKGYFRITANRFLRGMVRAVVGTLLPLGRGQYDEKEFCRIVECQDRGLAGSAAPPHGLFMENIIYPDTIFL